MATLAEHIAARGDRDLMERVAAAAEKNGIPNARQWAEQNMGAIVSTTLDGDTSVADVYAYAVATYEPTPPPGLNPAAVTDPQIVEAVVANKPE